MSIINILLLSSIPSALFGIGIVLVNVKEFLKEILAFRIFFLLIFIIPIINIIFSIYLLIYHFKNSNYIEKRKIKIEYHKKIKKGIIRISKNDPYGEELWTE